MDTADQVRPIQVVYILGNSFSGSTLLGFLVAATPDVLYLGELKMHNRVQAIPCSCGADMHQCPFWSRWDAHGYRLFAGSLRDRLELGLRLLLGLPLRAGAASDDERFLREMRSAHGEARYLLDASKSIWRLAHLAAIHDVELSVIYVRRGLHANVSSFVKRGSWFWSALGRCVLNTHLAGRFLARHPELRLLHVNYEELCDDPDAALRQIAGFLAVDYYGDYRGYLESARFHVRSGNARTIRQAREGLRVRPRQEDWRARFGPFRNALLDLLARRDRRDLANGLADAP